MKRINSNCLPEELPGVKKKSFSMSFAGSEIWFEHLDGMYDYTNLVIDKFIEDALFFQKLSAPSIMAINLDETDVNKEIQNAITTTIKNGKKRFTRIVFVGLDKRKQKEMQKLLSEGDKSFALAFINDFEKAKEWLVLEKNS